MQESKRAIEIDPLAVLPAVHELLIRMMEEEHEFVIDSMNKLIARDPQIVKTYWWIKGYCYTQIGEFEKALALCQDSIETSNRHPWTIAYSGYIMAKCGETEKANALYHNFIETARTKYISPFTLCIIPMALGNIDEALDHLEKGIELSDSAMMLTKRWKMFSAFHDNPRFNSILKRAKLI